MPSDTVHVRLAGLTDVGLVREHNEDSFLVVDLDQGVSDLAQLRDYELLENGTLLLVCDGMGGAAAGEVASNMAVDGMRRALLEQVGRRSSEAAAEPAPAPIGTPIAAPIGVEDGEGPTEGPGPEAPGAGSAPEETGPVTAAPGPPAVAEPPREPVTQEIAVSTALDPTDVRRLAMQLRDAVYGVNLEIFEAACADMEKAGMGTTLTGLWLRRGRVVVAQVGDSRAYMWRQGRLTQITHDQSLVNQLLDSGQITPEQAKLFEHSNVILQALGVQEDVEVLISAEKLCQGDRILVCSDGLVGVVSDEEIQEVLGLSDNLDDTAQTLIDMARAAGGPDNITVLLAQVQGEALPQPTAEDEVLYRPFLLDPPPRRLRTLEEDEDRLGDRLGPTAYGDRSPPPSMAAVLSMAWVVGLLVAGIVVGVLLYPRNPPAYVSSKGALCYFVADLAGLDILVNGRTVAKTTPAGTEVRMAPGFYRVALRDGTGKYSGATSAEQPLHVSPGQRCAMKLRPLFPAEHRVGLDPAGAGTSEAGDTDQADVTEATADTTRPAGDVPDQALSSLPAAAPAAAPE